MRYRSVCCGMLLLITGAAASAATLQVQAADHTVLLALDLHEERCWSLRWNHSVTAVVVDDYYCLLDGRMVLTETHTPAFDAGLGHIPGRGRLEADADHGYWIRDINEPVAGDAYWLRVGSAAVDHRIVHAGIVHSLSGLAANRRVKISIVKESDDNAVR